MLWTTFIVLTAITLFFVVKPMLWGEKTDWADESDRQDIAVYRDQLIEIDADLERGLLGKDEAESAKTEVSRRLLKRTVNETSHSASSGNGPSNQGSQGRAGGNSNAAFLCTLAAIPAVALSIYVYIGSPSMPGQPYALRVNTKTAASSIDVLVAKAEVQLRENPEQGEGWEVLAPIYLRQRRFDKAVEAYGRALDLLGEAPRRLSGYAAALISQNDGIVNERARKAFVRLNALQPGRSDVRFWLAVAMEQDGKLKLAAADYRAMLASAPKNAPWRSMVESKLRDVEHKMNGGPAGLSSTANGVSRGSAASQSPGPGPSASDIAAAGKMSTGDRMAMIDQMVARLADRLKTEGGDLNGWQRLVRAYVVQGKTDEAKRALEDARKNFAGDSAALGVLDRLGKRF